jgi:hypothetical protein
MRKIKVPMASARGIDGGRVASMQSLEWSKRAKQPVSLYCVLNFCAFLIKVCSKALLKNGSETFHVENLLSKKRRWVKDLFCFCKKFKNVFPLDFVLRFQAYLSKGSKKTPQKQFGNNPCESS